MTLPPALETTLRRFRRRVVIVKALEVVRSGVLLLAGLAVFAVIALRLFDVQVAPTASWLSALLVPIGAGLLHALRATPGPMAFASHVDRRGHGTGLLLASIERDLGTWSEDAARRLLRFGRNVMPKDTPPSSMALLMTSPLSISSTSSTSSGTAGTGS